MGMKALAVLSILLLCAGAASRAAADPSPSPPLTIRTGQAPHHFSGRGLDIARVDGQTTSQSSPGQKLSAGVPKKSEKANLQPKRFIDHSQTVKKQAGKQPNKSTKSIRAKARPSATPRPRQSR